MELEMFKYLLARLGLAIFAAVASFVFFAALAVLVVWHFAEELMYKLKYGWRSSRPPVKWL